MRALRPPQQHEAGLTLLELVVSLAILSILAAAAAPLYAVSIKREREIELRRALRDIRRALDAFHESYVVSGGAMPFPTARQGGPGGAPTAPGGGQPGQPGQPSQTGLPGQASTTSGGRARPGAPGAPGAGQPGGGLASFGQNLEIPLIDYSEFDPDHSYGYPENLRQLVDGVRQFGGDEMVRFLRRIPLDPMIDPDTIGADDDNFGWQVRSYQDDFEIPEDGCPSVIWDRYNVFDVWSKSKATGLDGRRYCTW